MFHNNKRVESSEQYTKGKCICIFTICEAKINRITGEIDNFTILGSSGCLRADFGTTEVTPASGFSPSTDCSLETPKPAAGSSSLKLSEPGREGQPQGQLGCVWVLEGACSDVMLAPSMTSSSMCLWGLVKTQINITEDLACARYKFYLSTDNSFTEKGADLDLNSP